MYIKRIELSNFKTIKDFEKDFEGNVYFVTGDNEVGKSTLLKSIAIMLTGERDEVLRTGEEKGYSKIILGDNETDKYEVELRFTKANPRGTLTITDKATGMKSEKVTLLQSIFGYTDFDATEFSKWSETAEGRRKQVAVVKSLLPVPVQQRIVQIDTEIETIKNSRKQLNIDVATADKFLKSSENSITTDEAKTYVKKKELTELVDKKAKNAELKQSIDGVQQRVTERQKTIDNYETDKETLVTDYELEKESISTEEKELQRKLDELKTKRENLDKEHKQSLIDLQNTVEDCKVKNQNANKWLETNKPKLKTDEEIQKEIDEFEDFNKKVAKVEAYNKKVAEKKKTEKDVEAKNAEIKKLEIEREGLIKGSKLPIEGLDFTDEGLTLNGIPFEPEKVSTSQEMEVAAKLIIAKNPNVKVFRVARGESLGGKRLRSLIEFANKAGYQGFIEEVVREQSEMRVEEYKEV